MNHARRFFHPYYSGQPANSEVVVVETLYVRTLQPADNQAESQRQRMRGKVAIGGGVIYCQLKTGQGFSIKRVNWCINIGMIKDVAYEKNAKDFILSIHDTENRINFLFSTSRKAKEWLEVIFVEARIQAQLYNNILRQLLPPAWMKVLKFEFIEGRVTSVALTNGRSPIEALDAEERKQLNINDKGLVLVDTCLREEVDMWVLARGDAHPDVAESCERLSIWLLTVDKKEESDYWYNEAIQARSRYTKKMKSDLGTMADNNQYKSIALDRIRNPVGMQNADTLLNAKEKSGVANKDERRERLLNNFKRALFGTPTE